MLLTMLQCAEVYALREETGQSEKKKNETTKKSGLQGHSFV